MLRISSDLQLPDEAVTQTFGILAKRGVGKTYTANVMAEEMLKTGHHVVIIDPIGVWYGLRSSADGKKEGLPIIIAGGEHADVPITPESGEVLANMIVDNRLSMVVDVSLFRKGQQVKFMTDFAETLYRRNRNALHLILDEADAFAPQRPMPGEQRLLGAIEDIVRRGRARGLGVTMITQRPSVLNKNVLTQIEVLVALRLTAPIDQKAVDEWVKTNAEEGQREEFLGAIGSLPIGTAYFWSPGWLKIFQKVQVRKRETLDSSSTPIAGKEVIKPQKMAPVDLDAIRDQLTVAVEEVQSNDPKALKKKVKELQAELAKRPTPVETVRIDVVPDDLVKTIVFHTKEIEKHTAAIDRALMDESKKLTPKFKEIQQKVKNHEISDSAAAFAVSIDTTYRPTGGAQRMIDVLGQPPFKFTKHQLAALAGMSPKSGTFQTYLSALRSNALVKEDGMMISLTANGQGLRSDSSSAPNTTEEVIDMWRGNLTGGARRMFDVLVEIYPKTISRPDLGERTEMSSTSGTFGTYLSKLNRVGLIQVENQQIKANDSLFAMEVELR